MKTLSKSKGVKEKVICKHCSDTGRVWSSIGNFVPCETENYCVWAVERTANRLIKEREALMQQFLKENPMVLSDDVPYKFNEWVSNLESK